MKVALFPGSFDPVTNGHLDVIQRAIKIFDKMIVLVAKNESKNSLFSVQERVVLLEAICKEKGIENIEVLSFNGLLVDAMRKFGTSVVVRGLRAVSDFEFEFQMALMNRELDDFCETIFMMPSPEYSFVSSRIIKEIARLGGDISAFVPEAVIDALVNKNAIKRK
jgi:pantetheine-phosphate adenylyltransferase